MKYIVVDEEGNNTVWDEEAELPTIFKDKEAAKQAAMAEASNNPGNIVTVYAEIASVKAAVRKPKVTVTESMNNGI